MRDRGSTKERTAGWRFSNVPVPEPHVFGLLAGGLLHALRPHPVTHRSRLALLSGVGLVVTGLAVVGWAVRTVGDADVEHPTELVTTGPYAVSRNPMYVAWTALYAGVALAANAIWPLVLLPAVAAATHVVVRREERRLEAAFGEAYRDYRDDVSRYL